MISTSHRTLRRNIGLVEDGNAQVLIDHGNLVKFPAKVWIVDPPRFDFSPVFTLQKVRPGTDSSSIQPLMLHLGIGILEGLGKFQTVTENQKYVSGPGNSVFGTLIFFVLSSPEQSNTLTLLIWSRWMATLGVVNRPSIWRDLGLDYECRAVCQNHAADKPVENHVSTIIQARFVPLETPKIRNDVGHHCSLCSVSSCGKAENQTGFGDSLFSNGETGSRLQKKSQL